MQHSDEFLTLTARAKANIREASVREVAENYLKQPGSVLIDVREDHEWQQGHIPGAVHLSRGIIERDIVQRFPDKDTLLILYCGGGYRSALAAESLQKMGYTHVISMDGGYKGWCAAGLATTEESRD